MFIDKKKVCLLFKCQVYELTQRVEVSATKPVDLGWFLAPSDSSSRPLNTHGL